MKEWQMKTEQRKLKKHKNQKLSDEEDKDHWQNFWQLTERLSEEETIRSKDKQRRNTDQEASITKNINIRKNAGMGTNASMIIAHLPMPDKIKNIKTIKDIRKHASMEKDVGMTIAHLFMKSKSKTR